MTHEDLVDKLNELIETCKDGELACRAAAAHAKSAPLRQLLDTRTEAYHLAEAELEALVIELGGRPEAHGSAAGALHRGWMTVKSLMGGSDADLVLLEDCARDEDEALRRYSAAFAMDLPPGVRPVVERQLDGVRRTCADMRLMRDQERIAEHH